METKSRVASQVNPNIRQIFVELEITDTTNKSFPFPVNKELNNAKRIIAVESFHAGIIPFTPTQKTVVAKAIHSKTFLNFSNSTSTLMRTLPLPFITIDDARHRVDPLNLDSFDMQQSGVLIADTTGVVLGTKFLFLFTYEKRSGEE